MIRCWGFYMNMAALFFGIAIWNLNVAAVVAFYDKRDFDGCSIMLVAFGCKFIWDSLRIIAKM